MNNVKLKMLINGMKHR